MRRVALFLVACVAVVSAIGLWAQEADSVVPAINPPAASQPVPRLIMFSGTVKDLTGKPLTGPVELNFAIYKEQTDAAPLWQESQTLNLDEQGHYTALLGAMQPEGLPVDLFTSGEARWLGVSAGNPSASSGQWLPEQPRVLLVSVPYALKANDAEMLGGKPASAYALAQPPLGPLLGKEGSGVVDRLPGGLAMPGKPKSGPKPNATGTGTQYYIPVWTDGQGTLGNSVMYQSGSNIGIGTTTPTYLLDVVGGAARIANPSGTTQLQVSGSATSGRLGQDAAGFYFSSDTNGAALRFLTNNGSLNEWMRITSGGSVGIGTATPMYRLDVVGGSARVTNPSGTTQLTVSGSDTSGRLGQDAAGFFFSSDTNGAALRFLTNNGSLNEWMRITSEGNIGIGTASPGARLDVQGNGGGHIRMGDAGISNYGAISLNNILNPTGYNFSSSPADLTLYINRPAGNAIAFLENNDVAEQMVIATGGNVGIGTATPVSALDVAGTTGLTWTDWGDNLGLATFGTPATGGSLYLNTPSLNSKYQSGLGIDGTFGTPSGQSVINIKALGVHASGSAAWGSQLAFWTTNGTALNQQMTIDKAGNVGIGTATPATPLHVASGDVYSSQAGSGVIVKSPDGTKCARIGIGNDGNLLVTALACP